MRILYKRKIQNNDINQSKHKITPTPRGVSTSSHSDKKNVIVRQPPKSFANALTTSQFTNGEKPDYDLALKQHNQ